MNGLVAPELFQIFPYFRSAGKHWLSHFRNVFALVEGGEQSHFSDSVPLFTQQLAPFLRFPIGNPVVTDMNSNKEFRSAIGADGEDEFIPRAQFTARAT